MTAQRAERESPYRPLPAVQRQAVFCRSCRWLDWTDGSYGEPARPRCRAAGPEFDPIHGFISNPRERNAQLDCEAYEKQLPWWTRLWRRWTT